MKSQMMETSTPRVFASARMRSTWWLAPSTSATQARVWFGSRRSASSKMACTTLAASSTTLAVSQLLLAVGPAVTSARLAPAVRKDVGRGAHDGCRVVDGAQFGHAFAVALLALGQPGRQLGGGLRGGPGGGRAQRLGAHHDALAVGREGQHVARIGGRRQGHRDAPRG